ncbi:MAG: methyltransferase [Desulfomonilaceae bacterium]|nr:methyltransferase [Desulfomonilaceae bacterium]
MNSSRMPVDEKQIVVTIADLEVRLLTPAAREESGDRISFWWGVTSAAVALAGHLTRLGELRNDLVVDLGCGLGLAGITAGLLGASVTFTDYMPEALEFARKNCVLNGMDINRSRFLELDWENPGDIGGFTMAIGSEIAYDYFTHSALIKLMELLTAPEGRIILAERKRLAVSRFVGRLRNRGFSSSETKYRIDNPDLPRQEITLFTIERADQ